MRETVRCQPWWYWAVIGGLLLVGLGVWSSSSENSPTAVFAAPGHRNDDGDPTPDEMAVDFRQFLGEVGQLTAEQQQEVWQGLQDRSDSVAEQTLFHFFSLPDDQQEHLVDRTIERLEARRREMGWGAPGGPPPGHWGGHGHSREVGYRPFSQLSLEERLAARRDMWEDATMRAHAMRSELHRMIEERCNERGIPYPMRRFG